MKRKRIFILVSIFGSAASVVVILLMMTASRAKRGPRPIVPPVDVAGVEFRAPNTLNTEGCIEAWDIKSDTLLWRKKVYYSLRIPFAEEDNQWVFIKNMTLGQSGDELIVVNEEGRTYIAKTTPPKTWNFRIGVFLLLLAAVYVLFRIWKKMFWSSRAMRA